MRVLCQKEPDARSAPARKNRDEETDTEKGDKGADIQRDVPAEDRSRRRTTETHDTARRAGDRKNGGHVREREATKTRTREVAQRAHHNLPPVNTAQLPTLHTTHNSPAPTQLHPRVEQLYAGAHDLSYRVRRWVPGSGSRSRLACLQGMNFTHTHTHVDIR